MKNMVKMTLGLSLLGMVSAGLLTGVNMLTEPVIEANIHNYFYEQIERYFPGFDTVEEAGEDEAELYHTVYDADGELLGYVVENVAGGYEGDIRYYAMVDNDGYIEGIEIVEHSETPGLGSEIESENFREQFVGKNYQDPLAAGDDLDIISGATISSQAVIGSLRGSMQGLAQAHFDEEDDVAEVDMADLPDGTFIGAAPGLNDDIKVEVLIENDEIVSIEIVEHDDTPDYFEQAKDEILEMIKREQTIEVDTVSGATQSSYGIINAVKDAIANGAGS